MLGGNFTFRKGRLPFEAGFFDLVVFDEASQCDIASALPLLYRAKSAVVIGDFKQLHHISNLKETEDIQLRKKYNVADENWSYSDNSLLGLALSRNFRVNIKLLEHHRSHTDIISFSNKHFYDGNLRITTCYDDLTLVSHDKLGVR